MRWLVEARPDLATNYLINEGAAERRAAELEAALGDGVPYTLSPPTR